MAAICGVSTWAKLWGPAVCPDMRPLICARLRLPMILYSDTRESYSSWNGRFVSASRALLCSCRRFISLVYPGFLVPTAHVVLASVNTSVKRCTCRFSRLCSVVALSERTVFFACLTLTLRSIGMTLETSTRSDQVMFSRVCVQFFRACV